MRYVFVLVSSTIPNAAAQYTTSFEFLLKNTFYLVSKQRYPYTYSSSRLISGADVSTSGGSLGATICPAQGPH